MKTGSRFELAQVDLLVRAAAEDDRLNAVEVDVVNGAQVARQLVHNVSCNILAVVMLSRLVIIIVVAR